MFGSRRPVVMGSGKWKQFFPEQVLRSVFANPVCMMSLLFALSHQLQNLQAQKMHDSMEGLAHNDVCHSASAMG